VLPRRAASPTWAHMNITPSLPHSNTYLCSPRFIVNITHQHDNDRNLYVLFSGPSGNYAEPHDILQRAAVGRRWYTQYRAFSAKVTYTFLFSPDQSISVVFVFLQLMKHSLAQLPWIMKNISSFSLCNYLCAVHFSRKVKNATKWLADPL